SLPSCTLRATRRWRSSAPSPSSRRRRRSGSRRAARSTTGSTCRSFAHSSSRGLPEPTMSKRLGVMGGTFDPIHHGHLLTAEEALQQFELDEVLFLPTGQPWMKSDRVVSPPEDRYLMVVIATASNPRFSVSRLEIERDGPTYTVDTLRELRAERGDVQLYFITGADAMLEIFQWKSPDDALEL